MIKVKQKISGPISPVARTRKETEGRPRYEESRERSIDRPAMINVVVTCQAMSTIACSVCVLDLHPAEGPSVQNPSLAKNRPVW